ncbi:MAG TPA: hypothetical protein VHD38_00590 [Candidatus Paceibacterota bacterium]|nr:hypothetical protein [Candidatus Paceibacterota bacterium]
MNKSIIGALAIIIIGAGIWYYTSHQTPTADTQPMGQSGKIVPKWGFESQPQTDESMPPQTKVTLTVGDKTYDAGTYAGTCAEVGEGASASLPLQENEVAAAFCYYAGAGDEIGIFREGNSLVLKHGEYQEPSGEGGEFRGNLTTLLTL